MTPHFTLSEFACKCGCGLEKKLVQNIMELAEELEKVRAIYGKPLIITSGVRCATHNEKVGGVKNSQHLKGLAVDLHVDNPAELRDLIQQCGAAQGGLFLYKSQPHLLHYDIRGVWVTGERP